MTKPRKNILVSIAVLVVLGIASFFLNNILKKNEEATTGTNNTPPIRNEQQTPRETAVNYKDGVYDAIGNYTSPGGAEEIGLTITLKDNIIVDSGFEVKATRPTSKQLQGVFSENYKQYVIGKNINEVNLTKVSSSSLTPKGFNDALNKIKIEAKA